MSMKQSIFRKSRKAVCRFFYGFEPSHMNAVDGCKISKVWVWEQKRSSRYKPSKSPYLIYKKELLRSFYKGFHELHNEKGKSKVLEVLNEKPLMVQRCIALSQSQSHLELNIRSRATSFLSKST